MNLFAYWSTAAVVAVGLWFASALSPSSPIEAALSSSVTIQMAGHNGCGGTIVSEDGKILTAAHCVYDPQSHQIRPHSLTVLLSSGTVLPAYIETLSPAYDLATLRVAKKDVHLNAAELGSTPAPGDDIFTIGSPLGHEFQITKGTFVLAHKELKLYSPTDVVDRMSLAVFPGNSGGGIFNEDGELIGVVSRVMLVPAGFAANYTNITLSIPVTDIAKIL